MRFLNRPVVTLLLACLLAFTYAECSLCGQEAQEKNPATGMLRLIAKERFRAVRDNNIGSLKFSPDGKLLAEKDVTEKITLCDALTGQQTILFKGNPKRKGLPLPGSVDFSPDGRRLLGCIHYGLFITVWDVESGRLVFQVGTGHATLIRVAFHPKGKQFAISVGRSIQFRDAETGALLRALKPKGTLSGFVFSADGKQLACAIADRTKPLGTEGSIELWDVESGKELKTLRGHEGTVWGICFSPCGKWIASASSDKTARIWDTKTGETVRTMKFATTVKKVAWSPDGKWLVVGGIVGKKNISIRDAATGNEILAIESRVFSLDDMALNAKGTLLAVAGLRDVQVWELSTPKAPPAEKGAPAGIKEK
jgi:WD40 repeat protein